MLLRFPAVVLVLFLSFLVGCGGSSGGAPAVSSSSALRLSVHEWGVWIVRDGRVNLDDLAREAPAFVHRAAGVAASDGSGTMPDPEAPVIPTRPVVVRKPVLFFHASAPTDITVRVGFFGGQPWLHFPAASNTVHAAQQGLEWRGHVGPDATVAAFAVPATHWWAILRGAGGDLFRAAGTNEAEPFLFYDGPAQFERPFRIERDEQGRTAAVPLSSESRIWLVQYGTYSELTTGESARSNSTRDARPSVDALRDVIRGELMTRGLTSQESAALLQTWNAELFEEPSPHAVYFLPRAEYDRALPMAITPIPDEFVRVGLILEAL